MNTVFLRLSIAITLCLLCAGCAKEEASNDKVNDGLPVEIMADAPIWGIESTSVNDIDTKTMRTEDGATYWCNGNVINVFQGACSSGEFRTRIAEASPVAVFEGSLSVVTGTNGTENEAMDFWAVYPYSEDNVCDGKSVTLTVKDVSVGTPGTFSNDDFPSVGTSRNLSIAFYNVCSGLALKVADSGIVSVTVKGNKGEVLAGKVRVSFTDGRPEVSEIISGKDSVVFNAPGDGGFIPGETYYIPLLPGSFDEGFEMVFTKHSFNEDGNIDVMQGSYKSIDPVTLMRSVFGRVNDLDADVEYVKTSEINCDPMAALSEVYDTFIRKVGSNAGANLYSPVRVLYNMCGDDLYSACCNWNDNIFLGELNEFYYTPENLVLTQVFQNFYHAINAANEFIIQFKTGMPDGNGPEKQKRAVAEARVLRAYMHMMLAIGWGNPPLLDSVLDDGMLPPNGSGHEDMLLWCAEECVESLKYLDERDSTQDKDGAYKVTKGFANAIAGKSYLFAGRYAEAAECLGAVVNSGKYALVSGERYLDNFHVEGNGNEEKVFECNIEQYRNADFDISVIMNYTTFMEAYLFNWRSEAFMRPRPGAIYGTIYGGDQGWGAIGIPQWVADEFLENDGPYSYRVQATMIPIDELVYGSFYNNRQIDDLSLEDKIISDRLGIIARGLYGQSFYLPFKIIGRYNDAENNYSGFYNDYRFNNYIIMRYAEVLLMYAEACLMTGDNATAKDIINQIQQRAGSQTVSEVVDMEVLKKEKKLEMWMEGCRWPDMVRWGDFDGVKDAGKKVTVLYDKVFRAPQSEDKNVTWHKDGRFYTVETSRAADEGGYDVGFKAGKHERFPIPTDVLNANSNLVQNPGW